MDDLQFKKPEITDYDKIKKALSYFPHTLCDYSPANIILWSEVYGTSVAFFEDSLFIKFIYEDEEYFAFPFVKKHLKNAFEMLEKYAKNRNINMNLGLIEDNMYEVIDKIYPGKYDIRYMEDSDDYVYNSSDLASLAGRKYHGKKNHVNKFKKLYTNWKYEKIDDNNYLECIEMLDLWATENDILSDEEKLEEVKVMKNAILNIKELGLIAGLLRVNDKVVAVTLGEEINDEMFVVHFEKALVSIHGAYTMINNQFVTNELQNYRYVNREEDLGIEGLRKAKQSYNPAFMSKKGVLIEK